MATFYIKTLGCKVNQYESQVIREDFIGKGLREAEPDEVPGVCIVNTCSVTERAQSKSRHYINWLRRRYPGTKLVVTGCTVDYKPYSISSIKGIDLLVTNKNKPSLADILLGYENNGFYNPGISYFAGHTRAFVKIQDGCNQFCSYCILPYVRGRSRSRDPDQVAEEVHRLVSNGYREVVLTGIHLGDYGKDKGDQGALVELLKRLEDIRGLLRIRLSSLEPQDITRVLIETVANSSKVCRHFHIPLQSGNDTVLKRMNRRCSYREYRELLGNIKSIIPEITFTTDIMVGFPGETPEQFSSSCKAIEEMGFVKVHIFPYSLRPGTAAAGFPNRVSQKEIRRRVSILQGIANKTAFEVKRRLIGTEQEVLVEKDGSGGGSGYISSYIPVVIKGAMVPNKLVRVRVRGIEGDYLVGEVYT